MNAHDEVDVDDDDNYGDDDLSCLNADSLSDRRVHRINQLYDFDLGHSWTMADI